MTRACFSIIALTAAALLQAQVATAQQGYRLYSSEELFTDDTSLLRSDDHDLEHELDSDAFLFELDEDRATQKPSAPFYLSAGGLPSGYRSDNMPGQMQVFDSPYGCNGCVHWTPNTPGWLRGFTSGVYASEREIVLARNSSGIVWVDFV